LINIAYLYVLPIGEMAKSPLVAASAADKVFGSNGAVLISIAVIISTFGALNGSILATARVPFAMARANLFFKDLGKVHPRYGTPHVSLLVQGIWSCVLVTSGSFDTITDYVIFAAWLFYLLGALGVSYSAKKCRMQRVLIKYGISIYTNNFCGLFIFIPYQFYYFRYVERNDGIDFDSRWITNVLILEIQG